MSEALFEAHELMLEIAGPLRFGDTAKTVIQRAHVKLSSKGFSWNRLRDIFQKEPRASIRADELEILRKMRSARGEEKGKDDVQQLRTRIENLEAILARIQDRDRQRAD